jgi:hypothetical protein
VLAGCCALPELGWCATLLAGQAAYGGCCRSRVMWVVCSFYSSTTPAVQPNLLGMWTCLPHLCDSGRLTKPAWCLTCAAAHAACVLSAAGVQLLG